MKLFRIRAYTLPTESEPIAALLTRSVTSFEFSAGMPHGEFTMFYSKNCTLDEAENYWVTIFALAGVSADRVFVRPLSE